MKKFAQILNDRAHWIFESEEKPDFHESFICIDITDCSPMPQEGWLYENDEFKPNRESYEKVRETVKKMIKLKLMDSDWVHLPDASLTEEQKNEWIEYRRQVKEVINSVTEDTQLKDIIFPISPTSEPELIF